MIIRTEALTKTYRRFEKQPGLMGSVKSLFRREYVYKTALDALDLEVEAGEFVGLIGPNGAGKTTLVKLLTGIVAPTSGRVSVMGYYPNRLETAFKERYAVVMGQKSQLFFELTAADTFRLFRELYRIPEARYRANLDYFVELFGVGDILNVQVRTLSLGQRMKLELIVALLHNPEVLFLDEPTIGLDAVAQRQIRGFLRQVNREKGTTILLTSHYMEDITALCPRCVLLGGGRKLYDGATEALFERYRTHRIVTLTFGGEARVGDGFVEADGARIALPADCELVGREGDRVRLRVARERAHDVVRGLLEDAPLCDVTVAEDEIGSVVERLYREMGVVG